jgi:hypothetical protein
MHGIRRKRNVILAVFTASVCAVSPAGALARGMAHPHRMLPMHHHHHHHHHHK